MQNDWTKLGRLPVRQAKALRRIASSIPTATASTGGGRLMLAVLWRAILDLDSSDLDTRADAIRYLNQARIPHAELIGLEPSFIRRTCIQYGLI